MEGNEITSPLPLLDGAGRPLNFGWARGPFFEYNPPFLGGAPKTRINETERYIIFSPTHILIFEVIDGGFLGHLGVSIVSMKDKGRSTQNIDSLFPLGRFNLPNGPEQGAVKIREKGCLLDFVPMEGGARIIKVDIPRFGRHRYLRGEVALSPPPAAQSIVTAAPWRRDKWAFRLFRCSPWYVTEGVMQFGAVDLYFTKDNAWGIHDWKREVRPRRDIRYWAAACGAAGGRRIGFNAGYGSADSGAGTENAFFLDGVIHKLDQVAFHIPPANWLREWALTSNDKRLEMIFTPNQERTGRGSVLLHSVTCRQVFGTFSGRVILDNGETLTFWNITGFAERRKTRF
ncbi:MAG: DUF2804 domain-containing protein [Treponema sp.]|jgi:hypothetical protein|nr:DUF2804 domain-containing protein [Treponema sp.]